MKKLLKSKKGLSPVVAAIILIAVTVAVSIAVAAWMGALTIGFMGTEELRFTNFVWEDATPITYVDMTVKNSGTAKLTIDSIKINNQIVTGWTVTDPASGSKTLDANAEATIQINYPGNFTAGDNYAFIVVTSKNNQFGPYTIAAPL